MEVRFRSPAEHAGDWRLAARAGPHDTRLVATLEDARRVLLVCAGEGDWWAVAARCRRCGGDLDPGTPPTAGPAEAVSCPACGTAVGRREDAAACIPTMVVDDEIYLLTPLAP